jgi:hypothetical protein
VSKNGLLKNLGLLCVLVLAGLWATGRLDISKLGGPWLIFLLCPLMHLGMMFGMRGHMGHGHGHGSHPEASQTTPKEGTAREQCH